MLLHAPGGISPPSTTRWTKRRRLSFAFLERSAPRLTGSIRSARAEGKGSFAVLRQMKGSRIRRRRRRKLDSRFRKAISSSSFPLAAVCRLQKCRCRQDSASCGRGCCAVAHQKWPAHSTRATLGCASNSNAAGRRPKAP